MISLITSLIIGLHFGATFNIYIGLFSFIIYLLFINIIFYILLPYKYSIRRVSNKVSEVKISKDYITLIGAKKITNIHVKITNIIIKNSIREDSKILLSYTIKKRNINKLDNIILLLPILWTDKVNWPKIIIDSHNKLTLTANSNIIKMQWV